MPHSVPLIRPTRRPTRFMCSDAGIVASAPPATQQVTGSVASAAFGASASPASPLIAIRVELLVKSNAWHAASSPTLRRVLFIYTVSGVESLSADCRSRGHGEGRQERNHFHARRALVHPGALRDGGTRAVRRRLDARREGRAAARDAGHHRARAHHPLA